MSGWSFFAEVMVLMLAKESTMGTNIDEIAGLTMQFKWLMMLHAHRSQLFLLLLFFIVIHKLFKIL